MPEGYIDLYCERLGPGIFAEPLNAVTNLAFLVAAFLSFRRASRAQQGCREVSLLSTLLTFVGLASLTFHLCATTWAAALDSNLILLFVVTFVVLFARRGLGWPWGAVLLLALAAYSATFLGAALGAVVGMSSGAHYLGFVVLALLLSCLSRLAEVRRLLWSVAALFSLSLAFRTVDLLWCPWLPIGTHFLWHLCNAGVCYLVIEAFRCQRFAASPS